MFMIQAINQKIPAIPSMLIMIKSIDDKHPLKHPPKQHPEELSDSFSSVGMLEAFSSVTVGKWLLFLQLDVLSSNCLYVLSWFEYLSSGGGILFSYIGVL